jgi:hypothetical protein
MRSKKDKNNFLRKECPGQFYAGASPRSEQQVSKYQCQPQKETNPPTDLSKTLMI